MDRRIRSPIAHLRLQSLGLTLVAAMAFMLAGCSQGDGQTAVVVYTSLDQPFSEPVLQEFERRTGVKVKAVYDVEAAKTTGLVNRLIAESGNPQADVYWSSEYAQTLLLKEKGVLAPYISPSAEGIPPLYRDPDDCWTGFGARARVIIVNTELVPTSERPRSIFDLLDPRWEGEVGIANPLFGTTATHAAALYAGIGVEKTQQFFLDLLEHKARVVDGNSVVRDMVVSGELKVGLTDTDDANVAITRGDPVEMIFPDQDELGTLLIPNTVALLKEAPHPEEGKQLIDFLLSADVEVMLANSESWQIPVRTDAELPPGRPRLSDLRDMQVRPDEVAAQMEASSKWLRESFLK